MEKTVDDYKSQVIYLSGYIPEIKKKINNISNELEIKKDKLNQLDEAKNILTILKNYKLESKKEFILNIINTALNDVFGQNVRIDIEATASKDTGKINMKYDIVLYQNEIEMARNEKLLGNNGGGVLSFISILFKILVGYIYSNNKFFLFDESISQVSPLYRPRLAQFFKEFCTQYGFTIVLISQTDDIDEYSDLVYLLDGEFDDNGTPTLRIDKKIGSYPTDNYIYSKIKNFQSIVNLEFRYKGFVVIRGNNNIGKSASFRAINSLLFNSFDAKDHPRKNRKRGDTTEIEFGYYSSTDKEKNNEIQLEFKSNKVTYKFDNETYTGKKLAFEKIKDKVEQIGFKYVNLKETYKNFKGDLKNQTERLAITTQYDGFYLVGNKSNETDKVFNFLFDSTEVANALSNISNDINYENISLNELTQEMKELIKELDIKNIEYNIILLKYYISLITLYVHDINQMKQLSLYKETIEELIVLINSKINIDNEIPIYLSNKQELNKMKNNTLYTQISLYDNIINLSQNNVLIDNFISDKNIFKELSDRSRLIIKDIEIIDYNISRITQINQEIDAYKYYIDTFNLYFLNKETLDNEKNNIINLSNQIKCIEEYIELINNSYGKSDIISILNIYENNKRSLIELNNSLEIIQNELNDLPKTFGISECTHCGGIGYISHQH